MAGAAFIILIGDPQCRFGISRFSEAPHDCDSHVMLGGRLETFCALFSKPWGEGGGEKKPLGHEELQGDYEGPPGVTNFPAVV